MGGEAPAPLVYDPGSDEITRGGETVARLVTSPELDDADPDEVEALCVRHVATGYAMAAGPDLLSLCRDMMTAADDTAVDIDEWSPEWQEFHARYLALIARIEGNPEPGRDQHAD